MCDGKVIMRASGADPGGGRWGGRPPLGRRFTIEDNTINPRPTGGGGYFEPPSRFLAISSKPMQVSQAKLAVPSLPTFLHIVLKF